MIQRRPLTTDKMKHFIRELNRAKKMIELSKKALKADELNLTESRMDSARHILYETVISFHSVTVL